MNLLQILIIALPYIIIYIIIIPIIVAVIFATIKVIIEHYEEAQTEQEKLKRVKIDELERKLEQIGEIEEKTEEEIKQLEIIDKQIIELLEGSPQTKDEKIRYKRLVLSGYLVSVIISIVISNFTSFIYYNNQAKINGNVKTDLNEFIAVIIDATKQEGSIIGYVKTEDIKITSRQSNHDTIDISFKLKEDEYLIPITSSYASSIENLLNLDGTNNKIELYKNTNQIKSINDIDYKNTSQTENYNQNQTENLINISFDKDGNLDLNTKDNNIEELIEKYNLTLGYFDLNNTLIYNQKQINGNNLNISLKSIKPYLIRGDISYIAITTLSNKQKIYSNKIKTETLNREIIDTE